MKKLPDLRAQIDAIDAKLMALLSERFALTRQICALKQAQDQPIPDPAREAQILAGAEPRVAAVYERIFQLTRGV